MSDLGKIQFVKGSLRYKQAPEKSIQVSVPLSGNLKELDEYQITQSVNLAQVYDDERQASTLFLPSCKFQLLFSNQYSGVTLNPEAPYGPFNNNLYYVNQEGYKQLQLLSDTPIPWGGLPQYNEFNFIRTDFGVNGYTSGPVNHILASPEDAGRYNWTFYVSYPSSKNYLKNLSCQFPNGDTLSWQPLNGLPYVMNPVSIDGKKMWQFTCPCKHNLQAGDYVYMPNVTVVNAASVPQDGRNTFEIYSLGNGFYGSDNTIFNIIDDGFYSSSDSFFDNKNGQFYRVTDVDNPIESRSEYYVRRHTIINTYDDAVVTNSGFEQNAFRTVKKYESADLTPNQTSRISVKEDSQSYNISFNESININNLVDNLNRPVSELFITVINRGYFGWFNYPTSFPIPSNSLKEGWSFNLSTTNSTWWERSNIFSNTSIGVESFVLSGFVFYRNRPLIPGSELNGDLCEWNNITQQETVLSDCYHKFAFNPYIFNIGGSVNNPLGYYYKPFFSIKIKQYSDYIEEGSAETTEGIPSYAYYSENENTFFWRDIYPYGFIDSDGNGVNFPFMNGRHYPYNNFIFRIIPEGSNLGTTNYVSVETPTIDGCE